MRDETRSWLAQAREDLETSKFLATSRYYAAVFFAQQAAEKALKALYIEVCRDFPPKNHNLVELCRALTAPPEIVEAARELNPEYFTTRYPDAAVGIPADMYSEQSARVHLEACEKVMAWTESLLSSVDSPETSTPGSG